MRRRNGVFVDQSSRDLSHIAQDEDEDMEDFLDRVRAARAGHIDEPEDEEPEDAPTWDERAHLLAELPEVERLILEGLRRGHAPARIAEYLSLTHEAYRWRARRAVERLRFLSSLPSWDPYEVASRLVSALVPREVALVFAVYWHTTSQTVTARLVGRSQPFVSRKLAGLHKDLRDRARVDPTLSGLADVVGRVVLEGDAMRAPRRDWELPPGLTVFRGMPKAGATDLRDLIGKTPKSKKSKVPSAQLAFDFAAFGWDPAVRSVSRLVAGAA